MSVARAVYKNTPGSDIVFMAPEPGEVFNNAGFNFVFGVDFLVICYEPKINQFTFFIPEYELTIENFVLKFNKFIRNHLKYPQWTCSYISSEPDEWVTAYGLVMAFGGKDEPLYPVSPNNADPESFVGKAEKWCQEQGLTIPIASRHPNMFKGMLDDYSNSKGE